jgi:hemolysin activation/secretion protein
MSSKLLFVAAWALPAAAWAQAVPPGGAVEQSLRKPRVPADTAKRENASVGAPAEEETPKNQDDKNKIKVNRFTFTGYTVLSLGTLESIVEPYQGQELTMGQIKDVANLITREYRNQGYLLAWAYVPAQTVKEGVVEIAIVEGKVDKVVVSGNKYYRRDFISRHLGAMEGQPVLSIDSLERSLMVLNDVPNLEAKATLRAGAKPGTTDIYVEVKDQYPVKGSLDYDNLGNESVSEHRLGASIDVLNLWYIGHELSVRGMVGFEFENLKYGRVEYRAPIGTGGFRASAWLAYMDYRAQGGVLDILDPNGSGPSYGVSGSYPLIKNRATVLTVEAGFYARDQEQIVFDIRQSFDHVRAASLLAELDHTDSWAGRSILGVEVRKGLGDVMGGTSEDDEPSRVGASNDFTKFTVDAMRIQRIVPALFAIARLTGQYSADPLFTSEQLGVGGADTVRGYPTFDALGDWGYVASIELRFIPPFLSKLDDPFTRGNRTMADVFQIGAFFDYGEAILEDPQAGERENSVLYGAGGGIRLNWPTVSIRLDVGFPMAPLEPSTGDDIFIYVQVVAFFN